MGGRRRSVRLASFSLAHALGVGLEGNEGVGNGDEELPPIIGIMRFGVGFGEGRGGGTGVGSGVGVGIGVGPGVGVGIGTGR